MLLNFAWKCFSNTGSIEAYLLYKELRGFENYADDPDDLPAASDSTKG